MTRRSTATQLSFSLHSAANRMVRLHKPILEPLGLTFPQYLVILELLDGGPRTVGALGAALDMDTGTITPLVKRLEAAPRTPTVRGVTGQIKTACQLTDAGLDDLRRTLDALAIAPRGLA